MLIPECSLWLFVPFNQGMVPLVFNALFRPNTHLTVFLSLHCVWLTLEICFKIRLQAFQTFLCSLVKPGLQSLQDFLLHPACCQYMARGLWLQSRSLTPSSNRFSPRLSSEHPRRPRGSQSGREKGRDESFQLREKEPLGTDSHRTISKNSSGCRLVIGHKNALYCCAQSANGFS